MDQLLTLQTYSPVCLWRTENCVPSFHSYSFSNDCERRNVVFFLTKTCCSKCFLPQSPFFFFFFLPPYCRMWDLNIKKVYVLNKYRGRIRTQTKFRNLCLQTSRQDICEFVMSQLYSLWHAPKRPVDCKIQKCGNNNQRKNYCNMWPFNLWNQICTLPSLGPLTSVVQRESDGLKFWLMDFFWRA